MITEPTLFDSFALSFFGIAVITAAVLAAFSVRPHWRLGVVLFAAAVWGVGAGLRGAYPWPSAFAVSSLCLIAAGLLAVFGKRFTLTFPTVLVLWFLGAWPASAIPSVGDAVRNVHHLSVIALAGVGLAAFSRLVALAWKADPWDQEAGDRQPKGWTMVSNATGLLLVVLVLALVFELTRAGEPLGLQSPLGLLVALAEAVAGMCLWRATVQADQLEERRTSAKQGVASGSWLTSAGLMAVFILTGLAFVLVPVIASAAHPAFSP